MLQDCAQRLVDFSESQTRCLSNDQLLILENCIDGMHTVYERLYRQGEIRIKTPATIESLKQLDNNIIMTLEFVWENISRMMKIIDDKKLFNKTSTIINKTLCALADTTEERNRLLGLGWESELTAKNKGINNADV